VAATHWVYSSETKWRDHVCRSTTLGRPIGGIDGQQSVCSRRRRGVRGADQYCPDKP